MVRSGQIPEQELELAPIKIANDQGTNKLVEESQRGKYSAALPEEDGEEGVERRNLPLVTLGAISVIGAGIQFGWALQLSLLTPYVETLGIPHAWASFIWLCGPISGLLVQPCVGVWSDTCTSRFGRRRPFILSGTILVVMAVLLIAFSADLGYVMGDKYHMDRETRPFACFVFILGFWCLDLSNNTVQGPSRALLSDLAGSDQMDQANAFYSLWLAVGNILGYSTGAIGIWFKWFPWLTGTACEEACANLKAAFLIAIVFLSICTAITLYFAKEIPLITVHAESHLDQVALLDRQQEEQELQRHRENGDTYTNGHHHIAKSDDVEQSAEHKQRIQEGKRDAEEKDRGEDDGNDGNEAKVEGGPGAIIVNLLVGLRSLPSPMKSVLIVMALSWTAWFPFLLFDTDWMGREIFHGDPTAGHAQQEAGGDSLVVLYQKGVHEGALGLMLNSVVQAITSILIDPLCRRFGSKNIWASGNFIVFLCMSSTYIVTVSAAEVFYVGGERMRSRPEWATIAAVVIFAILGAPLAITFSVPYALTAELTADSGGGQGLAMGILNLAIVLPQIVVSLGAGPWDQLFGGGNEPAFAAAAVFALAAGIIALSWLPASRRGEGHEQKHSTLAHGGF